MFFINNLLHTKNMKQKKIKNNTLLYILLFLLALSSSFCMYQTRFIKPIYEFYLIKQIIWFLIGFLIIFLLQKIKVRFLFKNSFYFYLLGNILLLLVLFFGSEVNGAKAWFNFKFFSFQPSEFMKICLILTLANQTKDFKEKNKKEILYIFKCILLVLIPSILVFFEPDTGAIIMFLLLLLATFLTSNIKKRWFILFIILFTILGGTFLYLYIYKQDLLIKLIGTSFFYRIERILKFKDQSGIQINNALITIGNASFFGHGIQKEILYVPEYPTDFVFTLFISMFGFIGGIILLFIYFLLNSFFIKKLFFAKKIEYKVLINGFCFLLGFSQIENILMNLGILPIMGIPLPFLSYGGSNLIVYFIFIGLILNCTKKEDNLYLP